MANSASVHIVPNWRFVIYDRMRPSLDDGESLHYIGQSRDFRSRVRRYMNLFSDNCRVIPLESFVGPQSLADRLERLWVKEFRFRFGDRLENKTNGGQHWPPSFTGLNFSDQHRAALKAAWNLPGAKERRGEAIRKANARLNITAKKSEIMKRLWATPEFREKVLSKLLSPEVQSKVIAGLHGEKAREGLRKAKALPEVREKLSKSMRKYFQNPEAHRRTSEATRAAMMRPEVIEKVKSRHPIVYTGKVRASLREGQRRRRADPEDRRRTGEGMRRAWARPEERAKRVESFRRAITPETLAKRSAGIRLAWARRKAATLEHFKLIS